MQPVFAPLLGALFALLLADAAAAGWSGALTQEPRTWGRSLANPPVLHTPMPRPIYRDALRPARPDVRPLRTAPRPPPRVVVPPKPVWPVAPPARRKTLYPPQSMPAPPNFE